MKEKETATIQGAAISSCIGQAVSSKFHRNVPEKDYLAKMAMKRYCADEHWLDVNIHVGAAIQEACASYLGIDYYDILSLSISKEPDESFTIAVTYLTEVEPSYSGWDKHRQ